MLSSSSGISNSHKTWLTSSRRHLTHTRAHTRAHLTPNPHSSTLIVPEIISVLSGRSTEQALVSIHWLGFLELVTLTHANFQECRLIRSCDILLRSTSILWFISLSLFSSDAVTTLPLWKFLNFEGPFRCAHFLWNSTILYRFRISWSICRRIQSTSVLAHQKMIHFREVCLSVCAVNMAPILFIAEHNDQAVLFAKIHVSTCF